MDQPEWGRKRLEYFRSLPEGAPGKKRLQEHQGTDEDFLGIIADAHYAQFKAESYRQFAPGRLLFGERYNTIPGAPLEIIAECGKVVDVLSFQPYEKTLSGKILDKVHATTGNGMWELMSNDEDQRVRDVLRTRMSVPEAVSVDSSCTTFGSR